MWVLEKYPDNLNEFVMILPEEYIEGKSFEEYLKDFPERLSYFIKP